jgi:hypothetical protein
MGDYDFMGGNFDFGDMGNIAAGGTGANVPNLPDFSGLSSFNIPQFDQGIMGDVNIPGISAPAGIFQGVSPSGPVDSSRFTLPPGAGVTTSPGGAPTPPDKGFGMGDLGSIAKNIVLPGMGLGISAMGIKSSLDAARNAREQAGMQRGFQEIQQKSAAPLQTFGTNQLQQASAGHLDPAVQQFIDDWAQTEKAKLQQQFAHMGITDSSMMQSALSEIDRRAISLRAEMLGKDKTTAIYALQSAMGGAGVGAQVANQEQGQLDNLIRSSQQALAQLNAMAQ